MFIQSETSRTNRTAPLSEDVFHRRQLKAATDAESEKQEPDPLWFKYETECLYRNFILKPE